MKQLFVFLIFLVVFYKTSLTEASPSRATDQTTSTTAAPSEPEIDKNCTKPGLMCKNCGNLVNCVLGENDEYEQIEVQTCSTGQTCLRDHCTSDPNPLCVKDYTFQCTGTAVFPDPFNCRKFHFCVVPQSSSNNITVVEGPTGRRTMLCDERSGFDPVTGYCKVNLTAAGCPDDTFPVPICKESGQSGALSNKSIYYTCIVSNNKLIPRLYVCSHGKIYDKNKCV